MSERERTDTEIVDWMEKRRMRPCIDASETPTRWSFDIDAGFHDSLREAASAAMNTEEQGE